MQSVRLEITVDVEPEVTPDSGVGTAPHRLEETFSFGLHGGVRNYTTKLDPITEPPQDPLVHYRELDLDGLRTNGLYLLFCFFDRNDWHGHMNPGPTVVDNERGWLLWLNRPEVQFEGAEVMPPEGIGINRANTYLRDEADDYELDGTLGNAGYPDMGCLFLLGDFAMLGIRPGASRLTLTAAINTIGFNESPADANFYLVELDRIEEDLVNLYGRE